MTHPASPYWNQRKAQQRVEEGLYPAWEELLGLHRLDYWHCTVAQRSQAGWPDYVVLGDGWLAFVELKARRLNGRTGKVSVAQERYKASIEAASGEWRSFLLPDEWDDVDDWLIGHTGREIRGTWRR